MQTRRNSCAAFIAGALLIFSAGAPGQGISPVAEGKRMTWPTADGPAHQLRLVAPDGAVSVLDFAAGQPVTAEHD